MNVLKHVVLFCNHVKNYTMKTLHYFCRRRSVAHILNKVEASDERKLFKTLERITCSSKSAVKILLSSLSLGFRLKNLQCVLQSFPNFQILEHDCIAHYVTLWSQNIKSLSVLGCRKTSLCFGSDESATFKIVILSERDAL